MTFWELGGGLASILRLLKRSRFSGWLKRLGEEVVCWLRRKLECDFLCVFCMMVRMIGKDD